MRRLRTSGGEEFRYWYRGTPPDGGPGNHHAPLTCGDDGHRDAGDRCPSALPANVEGLPANVEGLPANAEAPRRNRRRGKDRRGARLPRGRSDQLKANKTGRGASWTSEGDRSATETSIDTTVHVDELLVSLRFTARKFLGVTFCSFEVLRRCPEMQLTAMGNQHVVPLGRGAFVAADVRRRGEAKRLLELPAVDAGREQCLRYLPNTGVA
jgi:hypothetical protein